MSICLVCVWKFYTKELNIMIALKVTMLLCALIAKGGIVTPGPSSTTNSSSEATLITEGRGQLRGSHNGKMAKITRIPHSIRPS